MMERLNVSHQLVLLDFNFERRVIKGVTELSIEPKAHDLTIIQLHCERPVVRSVSIDGYKCDFKHAAPNTRQKLLKTSLRIQSDNTGDGELAINIPEQVQITPIDNNIQNSIEPEPSPTYKALKLRIEFYIVNPTAGIVFGMSDTDDRLTTVHTETKLYPSSTRSWLPCLDSIHQRSTWDLFFSVPACAGSLDDPQSLLPLTVVSSGELSSLVIHPQDPLKRIYRYIMSTATPACTLGFAIGPFTSACTLDGSLLSNGESSDSQTEQNVTASQTEAVGRNDGTKGSAGANENSGEKDKQNNQRAEDRNTISDDEDKDKDKDGDDTQKVPSLNEDKTVEDASIENLASRANHNANLRKATVDAIGGVFAFTYPGLQAELMNTCEFIPEALAFHSQEFGSYPYATYKVVFMDGLREPIISCASLTIVSTDFLHPRFIIEQVYETRRCLGLAIAQQWFGTYIVPETWSDYWLVVGLAGYIASLFVKHNLGNNEHRYRLKRDMTRLCHADVNQRPISYPEQPPVVRQDEVEFVQLKAPIILYMIDRRMMKGGMSLGLHRIVPKILVAAMSGDLGISNAVGTTWFLKMCRKVSGVDLQVFSDQWIFGTGCPVFHFSYAFNRKKLAVEIMMHQESTNSKATAPWAKPQLFDGQMTARIREADGTPYEHVLDIHESWKKFEVQFNTKYKRIRRSTKRFHMRQMAAAAEELNVNAEVLGIEDDDETYSNIALFGAENEQEKRDWRVVEWGEDDEESLASATFEWIRMDSDMEWACIIHFEQPDFMWAAQLQKDRDVAAQLEAVDALQHLPSSAASTTLMRTVMDGRVFYRIRVDAALALEKFAKESLDWIGLHHLIKIYKNRYCLPPPPSLRGTSGDNQGDSEDISVARLPRPNNFANIGEYFTQKAILAALSNIRDKNNEAPLAARRVMMGALKYNDNSENVYSDCNFLSNLIRALTNSIINSKRFSRMYSIGAAPRGDDAVLNEIERLRKLDMMVPSYHNIVTRGCMEVLLRLSLVQQQENLFNTALFFSMATPDAYVAVREVAVGGLILHWGPSDPIFSKFFVALATDTDSPRLATTTSRYLMELMMIRAMAYGQQHNSLLFMEERGKEVVEYIDTDARLVGGMESFIDSIDDSSELRTIFSSAMYDSTLTHSSQLLLGAFNVLIYQIVDCSLPPREPKARKKLKIKLGGKRKGVAGSKGVGTGPQSATRSNASSDSEDMPLALSMPANVPQYPAVAGNHRISEDPFSADLVPGEFDDFSDMPLASSIGEHGTPATGRRKWKRRHSQQESYASHGGDNQSSSYSLPPIAGTRPPQINASDSQANVSAYPALQGQQEAPAPGNIQQPQVKVKLKLKFAKTSSPAQPETPLPQQQQSSSVAAHHHHFSPTMSPPLIHSTVPRVSSPLAAHSDSPSRRSHGRGTPSAWSPAYNPPEIDTSTEFGVPRERQRADSYPVLKDEYPLDNIGQNNEGADSQNQMASVNVGGSLEKTGKIKRAKTEKTAKATQPNSSGLSSATQKLLTRILRKISKHHSAFPFSRPVDVVLDGCPTYYDIIKHPMDLGTIKTKLESPGRYSNTDEFETDIRLMLSNCYAFNPAGTPVYMMGKEVENIFEKEWAKAALSAAGASLPGVVAEINNGPGPRDVSSAAKSLAAAVPESNEQNVSSTIKNDNTEANPSGAKAASKRSNKRKSAGSLLTEENSNLQPAPVAVSQKRSRKDNSEAASFNNMPEDVHIEGEAFVVPAKNSKAASVKLKVSKTLSTQNQPQSVSSEPIGVNNLDDPDAIMEYLDKTDGLHASEAKSKPATKQRIVDFKAMCNRVLLRLQAQASALEFMAPVDPEKQGVPTYPLIVKNPMDLGTVRKKLDRNVYKSAEEFCHDVCLVLSNCFLFNKPGTYVHTQGETLNRIFKSVWKQHTGVDDPEDVMELQQPYEEIPMGDKEVERARSVINKLKRDDSAWPFLKPVDPVALGVPTYFDIVKNPMDLSTVQKKLGKKAYKWVADFAADIQLIVDDCFLFNLPDTPVYDCGKAFKNAASKLLEPDSWNQWLAPS
ncbi:hypothetical protein EDC05_002459 [Coemansia umbellata]|uniref:Transcription initiation factor TFIID subunit 2 n=1 Tax=Coemansia umbellata TaxID=1424467 RepID=A0ABQ8PR79_9FUNG|nr:hypothetical protein EDC05_002459 [Coemansia umbellata]